MTPVFFVGGGSVRRSSARVPIGSTASGDGAPLLQVAWITPVFFPGARQLVRRLRDQAACPSASGGRFVRSRPIFTPGHKFPVASRAASNAAKASTPCGDQLVR